MAPKAKHKVSTNPGEAVLSEAWQWLKKHPLFQPLANSVALNCYDGYNNRCPTEAWAMVSNTGYIYCRPKRHATVDNWIYIFAHCLLHLGFGHHKVQAREREWNDACCAFVARFLKDLKIGKAPEFISGKFDLPGHNEEVLYRHFCEHGVAADLKGLGCAGPGYGDMLISNQSFYRRGDSYEDLLADGLMAAVSSAVNVAGGAEAYLGASEKLHTAAQLARSWFISSYPLLGALAAAFTIVEDLEICQRLDITVAAVDAESKEIFINPAAKMTESQARFVIAHELLHVGLQHEARRQGRDPYLWNVACDYVINDWLVEMGVGDFPYFGGLLDQTIRGMSAEEIYTLMCQDLRAYRKLATLRGTGRGDMLERGQPDWWHSHEGTTLDEFYRRCLAEGLSYHRLQARGTLPAGLVEQINALSQPAIPWDVELAQWFDDYFAPIEKTRTFARPSRRQSASPDIPRPRYVPKANALDGRTFAVVLDTSGSMERKVLAKALGSIASYSMARDVPYVRLIFCDAQAYDEGYVAAETIGERVRVRGRGGTISQPGIDLIETAKDFPEKGPILIITDGLCDSLQIRRDHAFLMPSKCFLPFNPKGPVFRIV
jgi:predicted metal-dependent peptidase